MDIDRRCRLAVRHQFKLAVMGGQIRDRLRYLDASVDIDAQGGDGPLGIAALGQLRHRADNAFAIGALSAGIFIPAERPSLFSVFALDLQETSVLITRHTVSSPYARRWLGPCYASGRGFAWVRRGFSKRAAR